MPAHCPQLDGKAVTHCSLSPVKHLSIGIWRSRLHLWSWILPKWFQFRSHPKRQMLTDCSLVVVSVMTHSLLVLAVQFNSNLSKSVWQHFLSFSHWHQIIKFMFSIYVANLKFVFQPMNFSFLSNWAFGANFVANLLCFTTVQQLFHTLFSLHGGQFFKSVVLWQALSRSKLWSAART